MTAVFPPGEETEESKTSPVFILSNSDSDPSTDAGVSDTEDEAESDSDQRDATPPVLNSPQTAAVKGPHGDGDPEEPHRTTDTPKTQGNLHIHSELECGCEVMACQFSQDGSLLAVGLSDGTIKIFRPDSGDLVQTLKDSTSILSSLPVTALRFTLSPQAHCLLLATYASGRVRCWYVWGGDCMWGLREGGLSGGGEGKAPRQTLSLCVSPSGETAATGGSDSSILLYDLATHQRVLTCRASSTRTLMDGHRFRVFAVTFHPEREREFISGGWDNTIQFWDTRQQNAVRMLLGPHVCGDALQIDPAANHILSGSWRRGSALEVWDYSSGRKLGGVPADPQGDSKIYSCHWLGQDHMVAAGSQLHMLRVINRHTMVTESRLQGLSSAVFSSSVCVSGRCAGLVAASSGTRVFLLERGAQRPRKEHRSPATGDEA
ncbi:F-box/WD repeat-containing protein sel-10-like [Osmerus eperlanus]|uniref:F-box/WD repeat-containing protein sel-10-like n=1 Tax=Osmerus eperlanus TaxID=29151 RepID=UPI002E1168A0